MKVRLVRANEFTQEAYDAWDNIQVASPPLQSPFFTSGFAVQASTTLSNSRIAVLEEANKIVGFLPFERFGMIFGRPIAYAVSDYQGVVIKPDVEWEPRELIRRCGLAIFEFNHFIGSQRELASYSRKQDVSPVIDLSRGFEAYRKERREQGSEQLKKLENLARKLEREVGAIRLEVCSGQREIFDRFVDWKIRHDLEKGYKPILQVNWIRELVERIWSTQTRIFSGMLSALYAGEELVAVHFGMRSSSVWHYWMPTYNSPFSKYSPGLILLMRMAQVAPTLGLTTIDLGKGKMDYKTRFMNSEVVLMEGRVTQGSVIAKALDASRTAKKLCQKYARVLPI